MVPSGDVHSPHEPWPLQSPGQSSAGPTSATDVSINRVLQLPPTVPSKQWQVPLVASHRPAEEQLAGQATGGGGIDTHHCADDGYVGQTGRSSTA